MVATRDIEYGELIIQERPVMKIERQEENEQSLREKFEKLLDSDKQAVMNLCDAHQRDQNKTLLGIKQSNAFAVDHEANVSVLCPGFASKFNHSCMPNVDHVFVEPFQRVYAIRNINQGEELCTAYVR